MKRNSALLTALPRMAGVVLAVFLFFSCAAEKKNDGTALAGPEAQEIVALVNGEPIRLHDFELHYRRTMTGVEEAAADPLSRLNSRVAVLNQLVDRILVVQEAKRLGIVVSPEEVERAATVIKSAYPGDTFDKLLAERRITYDTWRGELWEALLEDKVVNQAVLPSIAISDEDLQEYYRSHPAEFEQTEQVRASQIVLATQAEAEAVLARLKEGADFAILAQEVSIAPERSKGGDLGYFGRGQMPTEFDAVVFALPVGKPSDVVKTPYGYHIFLVRDRKEARRYSFEEAKGKIETIVRHMRLDEAYRMWIAKLREAAEIAVNEELLGR